MGTAKADNIKYTPMRTKMEQAYRQWKTEIKAERPAA